MTDIRQFVEQELDGIPQDPVKSERLREALALALGQSKTVWRTITCKHCRRQGKYEVDFPQPAQIARAIKDLVELTKGKVAQEVAVTHRYEGLPMRDLPSEELLRLAGEEVVDGEFEPLALPAGTD